MHNKGIHTVSLLLLLFLLTAALFGCGRKDAGIKQDGVPPESEVETAETLSDEQALSAIRSYCYLANPALEAIESDGEYPVYWDIASSSDQEIVVLFRSYTGAQKRFYIDRASGETSVTEFVPGIIDEEQQTDESFNVKDYFPAD